MKMTRREVLLYGMTFGTAAALVGSHTYLNNEEMQRLKPKNDRVPADLHVHLNGDADLEELRNVLSQPGLVGITTYSAPNGLLNYYHIKNKYEDFKEIDPGILGILKSDKGIGYVLNAQEIALENHISALGCKELISAKNCEEAIREIHKQDGLAILNHPYVVPSNKLWPPKEIKYRLINEIEEYRINDLANLVDEVETFNGQCIELIPRTIDMRPANQKARKFVQDKHSKFKGVATSDTHNDFPQVLTSGIYIPSEDLTFKKLKQYIKEGDFWSEGNDISRASFLRGHFPSISWVF